MSASTKIQIIGIDCATDNAKVGLSKGDFDGTELRIEVAQVAARYEPAATTVAQWIRECEGRTLLAIDAPLGWPVDMGRLLPTHRAGKPLSIAGNDLFRRATDRFVKEKLGKTPLDVGADRIARTALAALQLLDELRALLGVDVPMAWSPDFSERVRAIEVYPAATLAAYGLASSGYKETLRSQERREILDDLARMRHLRLPIDQTTMVECADALDAAVCQLAARDFLAGDAMEPTEELTELAVSEGWIWVRARVGSSP